MGVSRDRSTIIQKSQSSSCCATVFQKSPSSYSSLPVSSIIIPTAFTLFNHAAAFLTGRLNCVLFRKEWQKSIFILRWPSWSGKCKLMFFFFSSPAPSPQGDKIKTDSISSSFFSLSASVFSPERPGRTEQRKAALCMWPLARFEVELLHFAEAQLGGVGVPLNADFMRLSVKTRGAH